MRGKYLDLKMDVFLRGISLFLFCGVCVQSSNVCDLYDFSIIHEGGSVPIAVGQPVKVDPPYATCGNVAGPTSLNFSNAQIGQQQDDFEDYVEEDFWNDELYHGTFPSYEKDYASDEFPTEDTIPRDDSWVCSSSCDNVHPRDLTPILVNENVVLDSDGCESSILFAISRKKRQAPGTGFARVPQAGDDSVSCRHDLSSSDLEKLTRMTLSFRIRPSGSGSFNVSSVDISGANLTFSLFVSSFQLVLHGFNNRETTSVEVDCISGCNLTVQVNTFLFPSSIQLFVNGVARASLLNNTQVETDYQYVHLPIVLEAGRGTGVSELLDVHLYQNILTNREILELYNGTFPSYDVLSDCLCPEDYPIDMFANLYEDILTYNEALCYRVGSRERTSVEVTYVPRVPHVSSPESLTDDIIGSIDQIFTDQTSLMWTSSPGVDNFELIIEFPFGFMFELASTNLYTLTNLPSNNGFYMLWARKQGEWIRLHMFAEACITQNTWGSDVGCSNLRSSVNGVYNTALYSPAIPSRRRKRQTDSPDSIIADAVKVEVQGLPLNTNFHAFTEISVDVIPGHPCECYSLGMDPSMNFCGYGGKCPCKASLNSTLTGPKCEPYISEVFPNFGVASGQTKVTLTGAMLQDVVSVEIGELPCRIISSSETNVTCLTNRTNLQQPGVNDDKRLFSIKFSDSCDKKETQFSFEYRPDPVIEAIQPLRSFLLGGVVQTVTGQFIDSVAEPRLIAYLKYEEDTNDNEHHVSKRAAGDNEFYLVEIDYTIQNFDGLYEVVSEICTVISQYVMHCPAPVVPTPGDIEPDVDEDSTCGTCVWNIEVYLGLWLDGVEEYRNISAVAELEIYAELELHINPDLYKWEETKVISIYRQASIEILGKQLDSGCSVEDYEVKIGPEVCTMSHLGSNVLHCNVPAIEPEDELSDRPGVSRVKVSIGHYTETVGYLDYRNWYEEWWFYCVAAAVGIIVVIFVAIGINMCVKMRNPNSPNMWVTSGI